MAKIKPFSGLYYYNKYSKANNVSKFVKSALNFDINGVGSKEQRHDFNVVGLQNFNMPSEVNEKMKKWLEGGVLTVSGAPAFYVCEMTYKIFDKTYGVKGFFAVVDLAKSGELSVLKLDYASEYSTELVLNLLQKVNFQTSSVFALYDDVTGEISSVLKEMCVGQCFERAKYSNVSYKVWEVSDKSLIEKLQGKFEQIETLYLAGGSAVYDAVLINSQKAGSSGCVLTFFMERSSEAIAVLPCNRVFSMSMFDLDNSLSKLSVNFDFVKCNSLNLMRTKMFGLRCEGKRAFGIYAEEVFGVLVFLEHEPLEQLDSCVVDEFILKKLFDSNCDYSVQYAVSASAAKAAVDSGDGCFAIFLNSPRLSELTEIVNCGKTVPKKAAYIFPRPVDGLVFYLVEN